MRTKYKFGPFVLDEIKHCLRTDEKDTHLRPKLFKLLLMLIKNRDRILSKDELLDKVWTDAHVSDGTLHRTISELRKTLGGNAEDSQFIETIHGVGFQFVEEVEEVSYREMRQVRPDLRSENDEVKINDCNKDTHSEEQHESQLFGFRPAKNTFSFSAQSYQQSTGIPQTESSQRIRTLFFPRSGAVELYPGNDHPLKDLPHGHTAYPNQERAMQAIRNLLGEEKQVIEEKYPTDPANTLVCIGSSVAHKESRRIMGEPQKGGRFKHAESDYVIEFPYTIVSLDAYVTRLQDGRERVTRHCGVIDLNDNVIVPEHHKSRLAGDILLVTRIPRILGGSDVLIFAGAHGPAIHAVELLLHRIDTRDLEYLEKCVEGSRYFQAVFHIPALREEGDTTVPVEILCDRTEDFRPRPIKVKYRRK